MAVNDFMKPYWEARRNWYAATPACLQSSRDEFSRFPDGTMPILVKAYPDVEQLILVLLDWFGHGVGTWGNFPYWEDEARHVLDELPLDTIIATVENNDMTLHQLDGAARFFAGGRDYFIREEDVRPKLTLPKAREKLLAYCLSTGDHDKIVRGRRAFDVELMGILDSEDTQRAVKNVTGSHRTFCFKLAERILPDGNRFVSPLSIALALAVVYNGARGETRQAIATVLEAQHLNLEGFNHANQLLQMLLTIRDTSFQLSIANSLWLQPGITLETDFQKRGSEFYEAEIAELDFSDPASAAIVNAWVNNHTGGKIPEIDIDLDPLIMMVLVNAIYFEANWTDVFDEEETQDKPFTRLDGTTKQVPMMSKFDYLGHFATEAFESIRLPYGQGNVSMVIFLPSKTSSLKTFWQTLTPDNWANWISQYKYDHGTITMPRFKFDDELDLNHALSAMGMSGAFDPERADFTGISAALSPFWLSGVKHKTFVQVDEEGTKAGAVTWMMGAGGRPDENFNMIVDRPFFFAIQDDKTGTILFMGAVVDPVWND